MSDEADTRMSFARDDGAVCLVLRRHNGVPYLSIERVGPDGAVRAAVAFKREELTRLLAGVEECRNVTVGHPKHTESKRVDPILLGNRRGGGGT